jgi:hypothetical protein
LNLKALQAFYIFMQESANRRLERDNAEMLK